MEKVLELSSEIIQITDKGMVLCEDGCIYLLRNKLVDGVTCIVAELIKEE